MSGIKLESYADWRTCIEHYCGIPLTRDYIEARIAELSVVECFETVCGVSERRLEVIWVGC